MTTPSAIVAAGYNAIATRYLQWAAETEGEPTLRFLGEFMARLPIEASVLDLGCGAGAPVAQELSKRFRVVGVDISEAQLNLARANIPGATLIHRDMAELEFPDSSCGGIVALASITHIPREHHQDFFHRLARWVVPGGLLLTSLGAIDAPSATSEWLGVPMFYSSYDADTNRRLVRSAGFALVLDEIALTTGPDGRAGTELWLLGQRRTSRGG